MFTITQNFVPEEVKHPRALHLINKVMLDFSHVPLHTPLNLLCHFIPKLQVLPDLSECLHHQSDPLL